MGLEASPDNFIVDAYVRMPDGQLAWVMTDDDPDLSNIRWSYRKHGDRIGFIGPHDGISLGYAPLPKTTWQWMKFDLLHGLLMGYPLIDIAAFIYNTRIKKK